MGRQVKVVVEAGRAEDTLGRVVSQREFIREEVARDFQEQKAGVWQQVGLRPDESGVVYWWGKNWLQVLVVDERGEQV
jgi:hypothetical protein